MVTGGMSGTYTNVIALICYVANRKYMTLLDVGRESQAVAKIYMKMLKNIYFSWTLSDVFFRYCFVCLFVKMEILYEDF